MPHPELDDLLNLRFTRRKLLQSERRTMQAFHRLFHDQIYDLEAEERHLLWKLDGIQRMKSEISNSGLPPIDENIHTPELVETLQKRALELDAGDQS